MSSAERVFPVMMLSATRSVYNVDAVFRLLSIMS